MFGRLIFLVLTLAAIGCGGDPTSPTRVARVATQQPAAPIPTLEPMATPMPTTGNWVLAEAKHAIDDSNCGTRLGSPRLSNGWLRRVRSEVGNLICYP